MAETDSASSPVRNEDASNDDESNKVDEVDDSVVEEEEAKNVTDDGEGDESKGKVDSVTEVNGDAEDDEEKPKKEVIKVISDDEFFAGLSQEEREWYEELGPSQEEIEDKVINCTACGKQITNEHSMNSAQRHPLLGVIVCRQCKTFYNDGEWTKDEEGSYEYCRWCGNGGDLLLCDKCPEGFCKRCVQRNLGRKFLSGINSADEWACFMCDPKVIYKFRAEYHAVSKMLKAKKSKGKSKGGPGTPKKPAGVSKKIEAELLKNPDNFVDKSLGNCFKAFSLQTKALEDEQKRWLRNKRNLTAENAVMMTKNLRKLFAATKHNMEVLDEMILASFHDAFPDEEFAKVRIPKVTSQFGLVPHELKRKLTLTPAKGSTSTPEKKVPAAKRKKPASEENEIVLNGDPVTKSLSDESFDPSSMLSVELDEEPAAKKPKMGPKSAVAGKKAGPKSKTSNASVTSMPLSRPGGYKVSTNMFMKKKKDKKPKAASSDPDSDIEVIDL